jgi:hypothetical protein
MDPSRLSELESINKTLQYWHSQFQSTTLANEVNGGGISILEKTKPAIKVYGFEDIEPIENITSIIAKRQILIGCRSNWWSLLTILKSCAKSPWSLEKILM